jgi:hypothetical protein
MSDVPTLWLNGIQEKWPRSSGIPKCAGERFAREPAIAQRVPMEEDRIYSPPAQRSISGPQVRAPGRSVSDCEPQFLGTWPIPRVHSTFQGPPRATSPATSDCRSAR